MYFDYAKITNMHTHMLAEKMKRQWQQNSKNFSASIGAGGAPKPSGGADSMQLSPQQNGDDAYLIQIRSKIQYGQDLSSDELQYLKEKYPDIYEDAMDQIREKRKYEEELRGCETKEEVRMKHLGKLSADYTQVKEAEARGDISTALRICGKINRMVSVFNEFSSSEDFKELAEDAVELEEIREEESALPEVQPESETEETEKTEETEESEAAAEEQPEPGAISTEQGAEDSSSEMPEINSPGDSGVKEISHEPDHPKPDRKSAVRGGGDYVNPYPKQDLSRRIRDDDDHQKRIFLDTKI